MNTSTNASRCTHGILWPHECKACADAPTDAEIAAWRAECCSAAITDPAAIEAAFAGDFEAEGAPGREEVR